MNHRIDQPGVDQESGIDQEQCIDQELSDLALETRILQFLSSRHVPGLRNLCVRSKNGIVTVTGKVLTFYEKQLCNQCCRMVPGILQLINLVDVCGIHAQDAHLIEEASPVGS